MTTDKNSAPSETDVNIHNAVLVLHKTYESVKKLLDQCRVLAEDRGYAVSADKFLRYRSDNDVNGWFIKSLILPFQKLTDDPCPSDNGWRDGPVYAVEVCLGLPSEPETAAQLLVSQFCYEDGAINEWGPGCPPTDHYGFHEPVHGFPAVTVSHQGDLQIATVKDGKASVYWNLRQVRTRHFSLSTVTSETLPDQVFGTFDDLAQMPDPSKGSRCHYAN